MWAAPKEWVGGLAERAVILAGKKESSGLNKYRMETLDKWAGFGT